MSQKEKNTRTLPVFVGFTSFALVTMVALALTTGCDDKKKNGGSKQKSIQSIQKQYKDDPQELTDKLISTARSAYKAKDVPRAEEAIEAAAEAADEITGTESRANTYIKLASTQFYVKESSAAKKSANKALDEIDQLAEKAEVQATLLIDLAKMLVKRDQDDDAKSHLPTAVEKVASIEAVDGKIAVLAKVAAVYADVDDEDAAGLSVAKAKTIADALAEKSLVKAVAIAQVAAAQDAYDEDGAEKTFDEAVSAADSIEVDWEQANAKFRIAEYMYSAGERSAAKGLLTKTKEDAMKIKDSGQRKEVLREIDELIAKLEKKK